MNEKMISKKRITSRIITCLLALVIVLTTVNLPGFTISVKAASSGYAFKSGDFNYELWDSGVVAYGYQGEDAYINIPSTVDVTEIPQYKTFYELKGIDTTKVPVIGIRNLDATGIVAVTMPDSVTFIGNKAFYKSKYLTQITFSPNITSIGTSAFEGCSNLESVSLPSKLVQIGDSAFLIVNL